MASGKTAPGRRGQRRDVRTLGDLYFEADQLNDMLQRKLAALVAGLGHHHGSTVKAEARALQKVFRSYGGDWRRLTDLVRASLVFDDLASMAAFLRRAAADTDLSIVPTHDGKMRLQDCPAPGGYRDVQLSVRLYRVWTEAPPLVRVDR